MWKQKETHFVWNSILLFQSFCVNNKENEIDRKKLTSTRNLFDIGWTTLTTTFKHESKQNWQWLIETRFSRSGWLKIYLRYPRTSLKFYISSKIAELKSSLLHFLQPSQLEDCLNNFHCLHGPAQHAIILQCWTKPAKIARPKSSTISCTRFLPKA